MIRLDVLRLTPAETPGRAAAATLMLAVLFGCSQRPQRVSLPSVDGSDAAAFAMENYDANGDGALDKTELAKCPPLAVAMTTYDADGNGQLSADEIDSRVTRLYGSGAALTNVDCTVTVSGRPLRGATVKFRPVEMFGDAVKPAEGVTDEAGMARPALADEALPDELAGTALVHPGLYHVEITHPNMALPARYNTATELGFEVDPAQRGGTTARFDLKAK
jgi:hypothetical protein